MKTRLKICGITTREDAFKCVDAGADILGFNFYPGTPRYISYQAANQIIKQIPFFVSSVGIFVRPMLKEVQKGIAISGVQAAQIYQPVDFTRFEQISVPVIFAVRIKDNENNLQRQVDFADAAMVLVDSFSKTALGGTGKTFNWQLIPECIPREKLILAGGINPENISEALEKVRPAIVDVASGAEISPGVKSKDKALSLVQKVNDFNQKY